MTLTLMGSKLTKQNGSLSLVDFATLAGKLRVECFIQDYGYTAFPLQSTITTRRHKLSWTSTSQRKLCLIRCSDTRKVSLSTVGKSRHFVHAVRSGNSDTHSASARRPWAQSYFTTQLSSRRDRQNNITKPDRASIEIKQDVRRARDWLICSHLRYSLLECV